MTPPLRRLLLVGLLASLPGWAGAGGGSGPTVRPMGAGTSGGWSRPTLPVERPNSNSPRDTTRDTTRDAARDTTRDAARDLPKDNAVKDNATKDNPNKDTPSKDASKDNPAPRDTEGAGGANSPAANAPRRDSEPARDEPRAGKVADGDARLPRLDRSERVERLERLMATQAARLERDPAGAPVRRREVTVWLPAQAASLQALQDEGFTVLSDREVLGRRLLVLRAPAGLSLDAAVDRASQLAPGAEVDFNHVLLGSGRAAAVPAASAAAPPVPSAPTAAAKPALNPTLKPGSLPPAPAALHVGLIDETLQPAPELNSVRLESPPCADPAAEPPRGHGTAVARLLVRPLQQAGRPTVLHAADLGCGPGAVDALVNGLQRMATARVPVVNVSAVGPHNRVMAAVVAAFLARGHLLVAAVGNDGPAAPPLYPAAYPGVVGVTAVDAQGRVLLEAGRGEHVAFAALGVVELSDPEGHPRPWRGTSFAAPVVAAALALRLPAPDPRAAQAAVADLARSAQDLGEPGRDRVYGHGLVDPAAPRLAQGHARP